MPLTTIDAFVFLLFPNVGSISLQLIVVEVSLVSVAIGKGQDAFEVASSAIAKEAFVAVFGLGEQVGGDLICRLRGRDIDRKCE